MSRIVLLLIILGRRRKEKKIWYDMYGWMTMDEKNVLWICCALHMMAYVWGASHYFGICL